MSESFAKRDGTRHYTGYAMECDAYLILIVNERKTWDTHGAYLVVMSPLFVW